VDDSNGVEEPTETQEELHLELELVNKVLSIDAANIETLDEFMQGGHLMEGDNFDASADDKSNSGEESFAVRSGLFGTGPFCLSAPHRGVLTSKTPAAP